MVGVASATLWITQQIDAWVMGLQACALIVSLARRTRPFAWQRSGIVLNVGMAGIVLTTIVVAMRGDPSTIALAHFAALTQGLQLLDARPRRTEYLLVTLSLFQVVLASNLTDSVFFTPMLLAFVLATVWTLLVHTLHSEAREAGADREISDAITPGLVRTTVLASALSVILALALFVTLPRIRGNVVTGSQLAPMLATAGFSETIAFGELGRIRQDATVVLRVETLEGEPPPRDRSYFRGLAFDRFDGQTWSITPPDHRLVPGSAEGGVTLGRDPYDYDLVQRVVREPVAGGVLFAVGRVRGLQGSVRRLERDTSGGLYAEGQADERVRYVVNSRAEPWSDADLSSDRAQLPRRDGDRYLQLPPLSKAIGELAREITEGLDGDAARLRALERHLLSQGQYTDTPPTATDGDPRSPVERFLLGDLAGHCEYFASGMVLLSRELGLPARLVNGFAGGRRNRIGGFVEVTRSDAHAWVEVHFEDAGWVRFDPTPADLRSRDEPVLSMAERMRELGSALELWWFQRVVGFDRSDQIGALKAAWLAWKGQSSEAGRARTRRQDAPAVPHARLPRGAIPWTLLASAAGVVVLAMVWQRRKQGDALPRAYGDALRTLARHGHVRTPSDTARGFALEVAPQLPAPAGTALHELTDAYLAARFGGRPEVDGRVALNRLRDAMRAAGSWRGGAGTTRDE
jgi:hypothetical protein